MFTIYHNPRCSKSREGLKILEDSGVTFNTVAYMKNGLSVSELTILIKALAIKPIELVRKTEAIWKDSYKNTTMTDKAIIVAMHEHPKLIERPIVVSGEKAVIGRPPTAIHTFLKN